MKTARRILSRFALGLVGVAGLACTPVDPRPSIVLVVIDTLRADAVSAYGTVEGTTPAIDALAAKGLLYSRAYSPSPWTLPSHASLFTGLGIEDHGAGLAGQSSLPERFVTLAERLAEAGYETAAEPEFRSNDANQRNYDNAKHNTSPSPRLAPRPAGCGYCRRSLPDPNSALAGLL